MAIRSSILLALCISGAAASPSFAHRVYLDINSDDDPWTINPISTESSVVVDVIVEVQDAPLSGHYELWFQTGSCGGTPEDPTRLCEVGIDLPQGASEWCVEDIHEFCFWSGMGVGDACEPGFVEGGSVPIPCRLVATSWGRSTRFWPVAIGRRSFAPSVVKDSMERSRTMWSSGCLRRAFQRILIPRLPAGESSRLATHAEPSWILETGREWI